MIQIIFPSFILSTLSANFANLLLCVIIMNVWLNSLFNLINRLCNSSAFLESKFPEGSSANTIAGELINARATATLCCSPPESSSGL